MELASANSVPKTTAVTALNPTVDEGVHTPMIWALSQCCKLDQIDTKTPLNQRVLPSPVKNAKRLKAKRQELLRGAMKRTRYHRGKVPQFYRRVSPISLIDQGSSGCQRSKQVKRCHRDQKNPHKISEGHVRHRDMTVSPIDQRAGITSKVARLFGQY